MSSKYMGAPHCCRVNVTNPCEPSPVGAEEGYVMSARLLNDARHWRDRAAQIRALSDWMSDAQTQAQILKLANDYDKLAEQARIGGVSLT